MMKASCLLLALLLPAVAEAAALDGGDDSLAPSSVGNPASIAASAETGGAINQREKLGLSGTMFSNYIRCSESAAPYRSFLASLSYIDSSNRVSYTVLAFAFLYDRNTGALVSQSVATNCGTNFSNIKAAGRAYD